MIITTRITITIVAKISFCHYWQHATLSARPPVWHSTECERGCFAGCGSCGVLCVQHPSGQHVTFSLSVRVAIEPTPILTRQGVLNSSWLSELTSGIWFARGDMWRSQRAGGLWLKTTRDALSLSMRVGIEPTQNFSIGSSSLRGSLGTWDCQRLRNYVMG